jgi:hypothetical protein
VYSFPEQDWDDWHGKSSEQVSNSFSSLPPDPDSLSTPGFSCQANEFSLYMLMAASFILNE